MEIQNVELVPKTVAVGTSFKLIFSIMGAVSFGFEFPFSNESLTEPKIQFNEEDGTNG